MVLLTYTIQSKENPEVIVSGTLLSKKELPVVIEELNVFATTQIPEHRLFITVINTNFIEMASDLLSEEREKQDAENYFAGRYPGVYNRVTSA